MPLGVFWFQRERLDRLGKFGNTWDNPIKIVATSSMTELLRPVIPPAASFVVSVSNQQQPSILKPERKP